MRRAATLVPVLLVISNAIQAQAIVPEGAEPNGYPNFTSLQCGQQGDGVILGGSPPDTDYWRIQCSSAMSLRVSVGPGFVQPRIQDTIIELRNAANTLLASNDDGAGIGLYSEIHDFRVPGPGTYFIVVRGYAAYTGSYSLDVQCGPSGPAWLPGSECAEPNHTNSLACPTACWSRLEGTIGAAGDVDRYFFSASSGQLISMSTAPGSIGAAISDTTLTLRNAAGTVLASNDDALGLYSRISYPFTNNGTYFVEVAGYLNQVVGGYTLEFDCSGIMPAPASMTTFGSGCVGSNGLVPRIQRRTSATGLTYVERPLIGTVMAGDLIQCPPLSLVVVCAAFQEQTPPIDLGILGAPGCLAQLLPLVTDVVVTNLSGTAQWVLSVPFSQTVVGASVEYQAAVLDPLANALGLTVSNRLRATVGNSF